MTDEAAISGLAAEIEKIPPRPHHSALLEVANRIRPGCKFRYALGRGGWYRQGGVIAADGTPIADNLEAWAKAELEACGGDIDELLDRHAGSGLRVTRHTGRTHYLVAPYGPAPEEFLQLEIEELQEVLDRNLIDADASPEDLPEDIQDLIEPIIPSLLEAQPVGSPRYQFRRLLDMRQTAAKVGFANGRKTGLPRFLTEWSHSSAAARGHFSDHWIVALREHQDRYLNPVISASLISCQARELKSFQWNIELSGVEMAAQLQAFDRSAGYPSAWYFHLVGGALTPPRVAYAVVRDLDADFHYLPDTEIALLRGWVAAPYSV
jgi:hypothetical protein